MYEAGLLTLEQYYQARWENKTNKRRKSIAAGAGGAGLLAAAGTAGAIDQNHITEETEALETSTTQINLPTGENQGAQPDNEFLGEITPYREKMTPEITEDEISEIVEGMVELTADFALDWIPFVGAGKGAFQAIIGTHPFSGRQLTPSERLFSGGLAILNIATFGSLGLLKSFKHSQFALQYGDHLKALTQINGEQLHQLVSLLARGKIEKAKEISCLIFEIFRENQTKSKNHSLQKKSRAQRGAFWGRSDRRHYCNQSG